MLSTLERFTPSRILGPSMFCPNNALCPRRLEFQHLELDHVATEVLGSPVSLGFTGFGPMKRRQELAQSNTPHLALLGRSQRHGQRLGHISGRGHLQGPAPVKSTGFANCPSSSRHKRFLPKKPGFTWNALAVFCVSLACKVLGTPQFLKSPCIPLPRASKP